MTIVRALVGMLLFPVTVVTAAAEEPADRPATSSRLALSPDGRWLACANTDSGTVTLVDVQRRAKIWETAVGATPEAVCWLTAPDRIAATVCSSDRVVILPVDVNEKAAPRPISVEVADEPYGVVSSRDGKLLYVTHSAPGLVSEVDPRAGRVLRTFAVGDTPRGIARTSDGGRLLVSHDYTGVLSAIDLASGTVVDRWKGASTDNLARKVAVHPTQPIAYMTHIRSRVDRPQGTGSISPFVTVVELNPGEGKRRTPIVLDTYNGINVPADPCEVVLSPDGSRQYILYAGTNNMNVSEVLAEGYPYLRPIGGLVPLGQHPRAAAVSPDGRELYVLNAFDFNIWVFQTQPLRKLAEIPVSQNTETDEVLQGKVLFHLARQPMTSRNWISCASCHPAGDHDGRTWQNPEGKRNTTSMLGMADTLPLHWSADRDELQDFEHTIRGPLMQGVGLVRGPIPDALGEKLAGKSRELDALAAYCNTLKPTRSPHALGPGKLSAAAQRGRELFESKAVGCAECHPAPTYTDSRPRPRPFLLHDVGTGHDDPTEKLGTAYDTPSLLGLYRSAPYLHDGSAATLEAVLTTSNAADKHGKTRHLDAEQRHDLVEFLKSLPFDR